MKSSLTKMMWLKWLLVGAVLSIVNGATDGDNPGIFSDGGTVGFPGPLTLRRSFAARHGGLRPPQLFGKPLQDSNSVDQPLPFLPPRRHPEASDPGGADSSADSGEPSKAVAWEGPSSNSYTDPASSAVPPATASVGVVPAPSGEAPDQQALLAYQNALTSAVEAEYAASTPTSASGALPAAGTEWSQDSSQEGPIDLSAAENGTTIPGLPAAEAITLGPTKHDVAVSPSVSQGSENAPPFVEGAQSLPFASFAVRDTRFASPAAQALLQRQVSAVGAALANQAQPAPLTAFAQQPLPGAAGPPAVALPLPQGQPGGGLLPALPLPAVPRQPGAVASVASSAQTLAPSPQQATMTAGTTPTPAPASMGPVMQPVNTATVGGAWGAVGASEQGEHAWGAASSSSTPGLAGGLDYMQSTTEELANEVEGTAAAPGEAIGTEDFPGLPALSPEGMPDPGGVGLPDDLPGMAAQSPYGTSFRTHTVQLPDGGTETVTVTTSHPVHTAPDPGKRLASFAQGVASGAQVVSSTLEQAAKSVSTEMPSVVSFAASTAKNVLNSLHGVDSSVRRASSLVANTINSLPAAAATPFVAGAPGAAVASADAYGSTTAGPWDASAATPAPLSGSSASQQGASTEQSSSEENGEGALAGLAHMAEKGVQRVAANIGASNDDSGPVLGNVNTR